MLYYTILYYIILYCTILNITYIILEHTTVLLIILAVVVQPAGPLNIPGGPCVWLKLAS